MKQANLLDMFKKKSSTVSCPAQSQTFQDISTKSQGIITPSSERSQQNSVIESPKRRKADWLEVPGNNGQKEESQDSFSNLEITENDKTTTI